MDKQILEMLISQRKSNHTIAKELNKSQTTIRYWLKKYGLKTQVYTETINDKKICTKCALNKPITDYYFKDKTTNSLHSECKLCFNSRVTKQFRNLKAQCIEYKGSKCQICSYERYQGALEFHHLDPNEKDFAISEANSRVFNNTIKEELDKCILLCSNCHREVHGGVVSTSML